MISKRGNRPQAKYRPETPYHEVQQQLRCGGMHLQDEAVQQQLADLGELGVDDGGQRGEDGREGGRRHLRFHQAATEQAAAAVQVLRARTGDRLSPC